ncbi:hypothetical protein [Paracidovorax sp. MALMAid1276]|uniref:hypothetical protein n=1 Tax=Paracidovorax sp. MALMAid1276 TaxID=3411631 RepID=UPI003B9A8B28
MHKELRSQRLVALFAGGWVLFNFPLLGLWDGDATLAGIPVFPAALFMLWLVLIAALAWLVDRPTPRDDEPPAAAPRQPALSASSASTAPPPSTSPAPPPARPLPPEQA